MTTMVDHYTVKPDFPQWVSFGLIYRVSLKKRGISIVLIFWVIALVLLKNEKFIYVSIKLN